MSKKKYSAEVFGQICRQAIRREKGILTDTLSSQRKRLNLHKAIIAYFRCSVTLRTADSNKSRLAGDM